MECDNTEMGIIQEKQDLLVRFSDMLSVYEKEGKSPELTVTFKLADDSRVVAECRFFWNEKDSACGVFNTHLIH